MTYAKTSLVGCCDGYRRFIRCRCLSTRGCSADGLLGACIRWLCGNNWCSQLRSSHLVSYMKRHISKLIIIKIVALYIYWMQWLYHTYIQRMQQGSSFNDFLHHWFIAFSFYMICRTFKSCFCSCCFIIFPPNNTHDCINIIFNTLFATWNIVRSFSLLA